MASGRRGKGTRRMSISDFTILFMAFLGGTFTGIYLYGILKKRWKEEAQKQDVLPRTGEEIRVGSFVRVDGQLYRVLETVYGSNGSLLNMKLKAETTAGFVPPEGTEVGGPGSLLP